MTIGQQNEINAITSKPAKGGYHGQSVAGQTEVCFAIPDKLAQALINYVEQQQLDWNYAGCAAIMAMLKGRKAL